jgi:hypothetical protein
MSISEDRKIVILKSLQHYSDILASLIAEEAIPEIVKFDLNMNMQNFTKFRA